MSRRQSHVVARDVVVVDDERRCELRVADASIFFWCNGCSSRKLMRKIPSLQRVGELIAYPFRRHHSRLYQSNRSPALLCPDLFVAALVKLRSSY